MKPTHCPSTEALAIVRLRQWMRDRTSARYGTTATYRNAGWRERRTGQFDARIVRMIDFQRAIDTLPDAEKLCLILCYGWGETRDETARLIDRSTRGVHDIIPRARHHLAQELERRNLI